jgi:hypothetical protein
VQRVYHRLATLAFDGAQTIDHAGLVAAESAGVADTISGVAGERALWRTAHKNNCSAKTYI